MTHLFDELQLKFSRLDTKIAEKKVFVENLCTDQQNLLREHFNEDTLKEKYSAQFNSGRQSLLEPFDRVNQRLEMDRIDELVRSNGGNATLKIHLDEWKKTRRLNFNRSVIRSEMACNWRLILKEFKFGCKFSASQIIKYEHVLDISEYLVKTGCTCDWNQSLVEATESKSIQNSEVVRLMIDVGADVNGRNWDNQTGLMYVSQNGHFEIVKYLVEKGADVNVKGEYYGTPLICACASGHLEIAKYLVENGADVDAKDDGDWTALMLASRKGHFEIAKYLVQKGADVNAKRYEDQTALMLASKNGHLGIAKFLVQKGAI